MNLAKLFSWACTGILHSDKYLPITDEEAAAKLQKIADISGYTDGDGNFRIGDGERYDCESRALLIEVLASLGYSKTIDALE